MSLSPEWEAWYANGNCVRGTNTALVKLIVRFVKEAEKVLELGTGSGGNIAPMQELGFPYYGIEGSQTAVAVLHETFPDLKDRIVVGDFTDDHPFGNGFDVVIDRASVPHNDSKAIRRCLDIAWETLKPGGLFISSDWFSTQHSEFARGEAVDANARTGYQNGQFAGIGIVHFSDERDLVELFAKFEPVSLEERIVRRVAASGFLRRGQMMQDYVSTAFNGMEYRSAVWDIVVRRPR